MSWCDPHTPGVYHVTKVMSTTAVHTNTIYPHIIRYLGRKFDMMPDNLAKGDMVEMAIHSQRLELTKISYSPDFENLKEGFITKLKIFLERFAKFVVKPFIFGDKVTYIDILAYEYLDQIRALTPESFTGEVSEYLQRVADLPNIAEWLKSEECTNKTYTINAPFAAGWPGFPNKD
eukprot:sb/3471919/